MTTSALILVSLLASADLRFEATTAANAKPVGGTLDALGPSWTAAVGGMAIAANDLIELRQLGVDLPALPTGPHLLLANGDRWPGRIVEVRNESVRFAPSFGTVSEVSLPLATVAAAWLTDGPFQDHPLPSDLDILSAKRGDDLVRLANRDLLMGTVSGMDRTTLRLDVKGSAKEVARERVVSIAMSSDLTRLAKPKGTFARVVLIGGARVTLADAQLLDGRITGKSVTGPEVRFLLGDLAALNIHNGPAVYLSELTALRYEHTPYLGVSYPYTVDRSVGGTVLRLGRDTFDRGIGLHSKSRLVYAVPAGATRFECYLGLDAETGRLGQASASVQVDGKDALSPFELTSALQPRRIVLPIASGAKEIALIVDYGAGANVQDHVNWADARIIKNAS